MIKIHLKWSILKPLFPLKDKIDGAHMVLGN